MFYAHNFLQSYEFFVIVHFMIDFMIDFVFRFYIHFIFGTLY